MPRAYGKGIQLRRILLAMVLDAWVTIESMLMALLIRFEAWFRRSTGAGPRCSRCSRVSSS